MWCGQRCEKVKRAASRRIKNGKDLTDSEKMDQLMALHEPVPPPLPYIVTTDMQCASDRAAHFDSLRRACGFVG